MALNELIYLKKMTQTDLPEVLRIRNDVRTRSFLHTNKEFTLEECKEWFLKMNPSWYCIWSGPKNQILGYIRTDRWDYENMTVQVGCDIAPEFRRKGYASEAYLHLLCILKVAGFKKVYLQVLKENLPAQNLYKKLGFVEYTPEKPDERSIYMEKEI